MGTLKVLASGCCFQDVASFSLMSRTTAETSFHHFCEKFFEGLWDTWNTYTGKEGHMSLVVECHSGRIIAATKTYPGAENDKTVIARDKSIWRIRDEEPWKSYDTRAWIIVDGGYPKASFGCCHFRSAVSQIPLLIPPIKTHNTVKEHDWSRRLDNMRKDIECCFGRVKGRWRLFGVPVGNNAFSQRVKGRWRLFGGDILFSARQKVDNAWFTACILHNMLHSFNRLDEMEEDGVWVGSAGRLGEATAMAAASMRKDIEVKGRWRLFGGDILFSARQKVDNAWFTACILHNMLHSFNRLDEMEEDGVWVGSAGRLGEATAVAAAMDVDEESETPTPASKSFAGSSSRTSRARGRKGDFVV
ncbi:unnamed protein product [Ectocarpus sp. CCAP 1310/34]|nr:unnamed protein product [Ectocarpus sp. CCAP 1310/34]